MGLVIDLVPELEKQVRAVAQQEGVTPDQYVARVLNRHLAYQRTALSSSEAALLKQINLGVPSDVWQRYHELRANLEDERLTSAEQQELSEITDQLEEANAQRIEALIKLAALRNTTLDTLMDTMGLRVPAYD